MTLRLVGTCPVCERQQKVTPAHAMVHHGYRRPGIGSIIGDCFGVGYLAYEISSEGCSAYRKWLAQFRRGQEDFLARLQARPETVLYESYSGQIKTYRRDSEDREERYRYEKTLEGKIRDVEYTIKDIDRSDARMVELIERWAPAPLVEIDEEGLTPARREERAVRKTERDTKRAEKANKQAAQRVRRDERLARKATTLLFFFDEFDRLSTLAPSKARDYYARDLIFESNKKKHGLDYPWDLSRGPDDGYGNRIQGPWGWPMVEHAERTLVALGVAKREENAKRAYLIQVYAPSGNKIQVPEPGPTDEVLNTIAHMAPPI